MRSVNHLMALVAVSIGLIMTTSPTASKTSWGCSAMCLPTVTAADATAASAHLTRTGAITGLIVYFPFFIERRNYL